MKYQIFLTGLVSVFLLSACGYGSSGSSVTVPAIPLAAATPVNVSLAANGGSVVATYGGAMANFVNDGDNTTTTNFWSGNIADDAVTIDFGLSRTITNNHGNFCLYQRHVFQLCQSDKIYRNFC